MRPCAISFVLGYSTMLFASIALADNFSVDFDNVAIPPPDGKIQIHFAYSAAVPAGAAPPASFNVAVSPFSGDQGQLNVAIENQDCSAPGGNPQSSILLALPAARVASACLVVTGMTAGAKYSGSLLVSAGTTEFKKLTINVVAATVPTLSLDHSAETRQVTRPLWARLYLGYESPADSVVIQEKSGKSAANGISARLEGSAKSPAGFNQTQNLSFSKEGKTIPNFFTSPPTPDPLRNIAAGAQSSYDINVRNLVPGEYVIPLRLAGTNTGPDTPQTLLTLTVHVRDSIIWAIICLLVAMLISLIVTKVLTAQQRRLTMRQQIRDLEAKRTGDTNSPAAVWVSAMLHLADKLSSRNWLTGADLIDSRINSTKAMIGLLNQVSDLRTQLSIKLSPIVRRRALVALDLILSTLNPSTADEAKIQAVSAQLAPLNDWLQNDKFPKAFWTTIAPALLELQKQAAAWGNVPDNAKASVDSLVTDLKAATATPPTVAADVEEAYSNYVLLKLLFDHKGDPEVFTQLLQAERDLEQCFHIADKADWNRVQESTLSIRMPKPAAGEEGFEAYDPLSFSVFVESNDTGAEHSYLFQHNVEFAWKFTLTREGKDRSGKAPAEITLEPTAFGPWITQYFPHRGQVRVSVELTYAGETKKVDSVTGPTIGDTVDFGMFRAFAQIEYISWAIAFVVALVTGLSSQYFKNATFGSAQDYLLLFLWGVGADQGKNLLQGLQAFSPSNPVGAGK